MKNTIKYIFVVSVFVFMFAVMIMLILAKRPDFSETEKRRLAPFPVFSFDALFSGEYTNAINAYYNDTIPGRDIIKEMNSNILRLSGIRINDIRLYGVSAAALINEDSGDTPAADESGFSELEPAAEPFTADRDISDVSDISDISGISDLSDAPEDSDVPDAATGTIAVSETVSPPETIKVPEITAKAEVTEVLIDKNSLVLNKGQTYLFDVRVRYTGNADKTVTTVSGNSSVAQVNGFRVTAVGPGTTKITFSSVNGKSAVCTVTVNEPDPDIQDGVVVIDEYLSKYGIIIYGTRGMLLYGGSYKVAGLYADSLLAYYNDLDKKVNVYSMIIPTACEFYLPPSYSSYCASQLKMINYIRDILDKNIIFVDAYSELAGHTDEDIYLRTDHHWAPLGAYYATAAFAKAAGVNYPALSEYDEITKTGFLGSLYATYTQDAVLLNNPEDFVYHVPKNNYKATYYDTRAENPFEYPFFVKMDHKNSYYCTFMGGDNKIVKINTDVKNGRKLVIIKESFGNAIAGYLFNSFEEIHVLDIRYFELNAVEYIKKVGATDVVFCTCTFTASGIAKYIERIRTQ